MTLSPEDELREHCSMMIDFMADGSLIPFLGAGVNLSDRATGSKFSPGGQFLPDAAELSESIANKFKYPWADEKNLLRVSWHASTVGTSYLYKHLHEIFSPEYPCTSVHTFFAQLPKRLEAKGYKNRNRLIVTTNYDRLLERAFEKEGEPYDLLYYVAHASSRDLRELGKFKYVPHGGKPEIVFDPNKINMASDSTVILKIHGAVGDDYNNGSFVITEDDYIDYLARMNAETSQIPPVLMEKMLDQGFLFMGYSLADWNLRVLLNSISTSRSFNTGSWAIMHETKDWDEAYWQHHNVRLRKISLKEYFKTLNEQLDAYPPRDATP